MNLPGDCLLAVVGLLPEEVTRRQRKAADMLPKTFTDRGRAWWTVERKPFRAAKAPALDKLFDKLATDPTQPEVAEWFKAAGDDADAIADLTIALTAARAYLVEKWPRIVLQTFGGPRVMPLSMEDEAEIASLWAVLNEPTNVLDEMDAGSLSPSQALAFRTTYPALYNLYRNALAAGAAVLSKDADWMPSEDQEIACAILTGQPPGLMSKTDAAPAQSKPPTEDKDFGASDAATQLDKTAKPRSASK